MCHSTFLMILFLSVFPVGFTQKAEWITLQELLESGGEDPNQVMRVTSKGGLGYWAGEVVELEHIDLNPTGRVKVQITWISDRTQYKCHEVYIMHQEDLTDFTHRSLMMRKCR